MTSWKPSWRRYRPFWMQREWDGTLYPVAFCTELLAASPNRGEKILEPQVLEAVKFNLDAFVDLGVTAVSMDIKYPALNYDFPRSDEYLAFFKDVVAAVRQRGSLYRQNAGCTGCGTGQ